MRKKGVLILTTLYLFILTACFSSRLDLFTLSLEEDVYFINEHLEDFPVFYDSIITYASITFKETQQTMEEDEELDINLMGDFSYEEIKVFEVNFLLGLNDEEPIPIDLLFLGRANPGRSNAYKFNATIEGLSDQYNQFRIVLELDTYIGSSKNEIAIIRLQIKNTADNKVNAMIILRNELQNARDEALKTLSDAFKKFKREDYHQENWNQLFDINRNTRDLIHQADDIETIKKSIDQALIDFEQVESSR